MSNHVQMECGWGCGMEFTAREIRKHFTSCPSRPDEGSDRPCWIYMAINEENSILKVGATESVSLERKLSSLRVQGEPHLGDRQRFRFLAVTPGTWAMEGHWLRKFAKFKVSRGAEWFRVNDEMLAFAEAIGIQADERQAIDPKTGWALTANEYIDAMRGFGLPIEHWTWFYSNLREEYLWNRAAHKWPTVLRATKYDPQPAEDRHLVPIDDL